MTKEESAYAAGLYEGEGSVNACKGCLRVSITMADLEPLQRMLIFGGKINGPYNQPRFPNRKPLWQWRLSGWLEIEQFYQTICSFLSPRRINQFALVFKGPRAPRKPIIVRPPSCGFDGTKPSVSGHVAHYKRGEKACIDCYHAAQLYMKQRRQKQKEKARNELGRGIAREWFS